MTLRQILKQRIPTPLHGPWRYARFRWATFIESFRDRQLTPPGSGISLPPPVLRARVHGYLNGKGFLEAGKMCAGEIQSALHLVGKQLYGFHDVLDFGCGCGRIVRNFSDHPASCRIFGTDIDSAAIAWCRANLPFASFKTNEPLPPLPWPEASFDLIYAFSVFTHLDEEYQFRWLEELHRALRPGGILLASTHGAYAQRDIAPRVNFTQDEMNTLQTRGFLFRVLETGRFKLDGLPDFYQCAFHSREYVNREWSRLFKVDHYIERGMNQHQDLILLSRP